jgi:hypothetical protein
MFFAEGDIYPDFPNRFRCGRVMVMGILRWMTGALPFQVAGALVLSFAPVWARAEPSITLQSPLDYQVFQRTSRTSGSLSLKGTATDMSGTLQLRIAGHSITGDVAGDWQNVPIDAATKTFAETVTEPAGGWYKIEVRLKTDGGVIAEAHVDHVGIGEVFVVAGQSNSTNYGSEKQKTATGMVSSFDGSAWRIADDPQPGVQDRSKNGSFIPAFGDEMYKRYDVPIGVAACGAGSTSVRQWQGEKIEVHPTTDSYLKTVGPDQWECTGKLFDGLTQRIAKLGPHGCRAVLWHQGESDAKQARGQITGREYTAMLENIIRASRNDAGWDVPWFVAQATYHNEQDPGDPDIRAAQKAIVDDGIALQGPDTDTLGPEYRNGVHMNPKGLSAHGGLWAEKVSAYLDKELAR